MLREQVLADSKKSWKQREAAGDPLAIASLPRMSFEAIDFLKKGQFSLQCFRIDLVLVRTGTCV